MKKLLIEWIDSRKQNAQWEFLSDTELPDVCRCQTIGFLLKEDQERIVLASSLGDIGMEEQVMGIIVIPACSITKITDIP